jgi:hypothetical protein
MSLNLHELYLLEAHELVAGNTKVSLLGSRGPDKRFASPLHQAIIQYQNYISAACT